mmetsp:Transcript_41093/g.131449  ORF Transcript_41093/g.131449 Transcript_41093/m.131449 type:complete len:301 (+) Transcript_41093:1092-1994(+)
MKRLLRISCPMPHPVSRTTKWSIRISCPSWVLDIELLVSLVFLRKRLGSASACTPTVSSTSPSSVNFTALERRLEITCRMRISSPYRFMGVSCATLYATWRFFSRALLANMSMHMSMQLKRSNGACSRATLFDSILEKSRTSLMRWRSWLELLWMISARSTTSLLLPPSLGLRRPSPPCSSRRPEHATIAFMGVRISWLMLARKLCFACEADSATSCSRMSERLALLRSRFLSNSLVMSVRVTVYSSCASCFTRFALDWHQSFFPSPRRISTSTCLFSLARMAAHRLMIPAPALSSLRRA